MATFQIRKSLALPPKTRGGSNEYPLTEMEIGDGFFIPGAKKSRLVSLGKIARALKVGITCRKTMDYVEFDDEGNGVGDKVEGTMVHKIEFSEKAPRTPKVKPAAAAAE